MQTRPIIGITVDHSNDQEKYQLPYLYARCVGEAGGVPVLLPYGPGFDAARQLDAMDGLLLVGGDDLDPTSWGQARHPEARAVDPRREAHERRLLAQAEERGVPVLAICFGMQLMNVIRGGSLHQHLPDVIGRQEHRKLAEGWARRHAVAVSEGSLLAEIFGAGPIETNTSHHQAVCTVGEGLCPVALADDGTVEALEDPAKAFWLGVQWHPERMALDNPGQMVLFRRHVEAAEAYAAEASPVTAAR